MTTDSTPKIENEQFNTQTEIQKQTKLLEAINGKLGFFTFVLVIYIILQILGAFLSI